MMNKVLSITHDCLRIVAFFEKRFALRIRLWAGYMNPGLSLSKNEGGVILGFDKIYCGHTALKWVVLLCCMLTLVACDKQYSDAEHVAKAKELISAKSNVQDVIIELKNALQINPENGEARWLLGNVYLDLEEGVLAEKELKRALEAKVSPQALALALAKTKYYQGKLSEFLAIAIPSYINKKDRIEWLVLRGQAFLSKGSLGDASAEFSRAISEDPRSPYALMGQALLAIKQGRLDDAFGFLQNALKVDPSMAQLYSLMGDVYRAQAKYVNAYDMYTEAIARRPWSENDYLKRASASYDSGNVDNADRDLKVVERRSPKHPRVRFLRGAIEWSRGHVDEAENALREADWGSPNDPITELWLGEVLLYKNQFEQSRALLEKAYAKLPNWYPLQRALIKLEMKQGRFKSAYQYIERVDSSRSNDAEFLFLRGLTYSALGDIKRSIEDHRKLTEIQPNNADYQLRLTLALIASGDFKNANIAAERLRQLDNKEGGADAAFVIALLKKGDLAKAIEYAEAWKNRLPGSALALATYGKLQLAEGDFVEARSAMVAASQLESDNDVAMYALIDLDLREGRYAEARVKLIEAQKRNPKVAGVYIRLAEIDAKAGDIQSAQAWTEKGVAEVPGSLQLRVLLASRYIELNRLDKALALMKEVEVKYSSNLLYRLTLGEIYIASEQWRLATEVLDGVLQKYPDNTNVLVLAGKASSGSGDLQKAEELLRRAVVGDKASIPAVLALAEVFARKRNYSGAQALLADIPLGMQGVPEVMMVKAWIEMAAGNANGSVKLLEELMAVRPSSGVVIRLARAKIAIKDKQGAILALDNWLKLHSDDVLVRNEYANVLMSFGENARAIEQLQILASSPVNDPVAQNNLAWLLIDSDPGRAVLLAESALKAMPENPGALDTLGLALTKAGQPQQAVRLFEGLVARNNAPMFQVHYAQALLANGQSDKARGIIKKLKADYASMPGALGEAVRAEINKVETFANGK